MQTPVQGTIVTTVAICGDGTVYDLGEGEYPSSPPHAKKKATFIKEPKYQVVDAFTLPKEEVPALRAKRKK